MLAAFLYAQLEERERIQARRREIWDTYARELYAWAADQQIGVPVVPDSCRQTYHMYYLRLPSLAIRQALIAHLKFRGILSVFHYLPLHLSAMGRRLGGKPGDCPVTEEASDQLLRLPFYFSLTDDDQARVIAAVRDFRCS
jgi:dTDP-4-amino-4,6-dideoxygalactose transaminase